MAAEIGYPARVTRSRSGVRLTFPDFPGVHVDASTWAAALAAAAHTLSGVIEARLAANQPLPSASGCRGAIRIVPSARTQAALLFRSHRGALSTAELGRRMQCISWTRVNELERGANITLDRADRAARAVGYRLVLTYEPLPEEP